MSAYLSQLKPGAKPAFVSCALVALSLGGCASWNSNQYTAENTAVAPSQAVAQVPAAEVEADGMPAQTPPVRRANQVPDDPSEPYSRNYGGPNPSVRPLAKPETPKPVAAPVRQAAADNNATRPYWKVVSIAAQDE